jgi:dolichol-phosphate mannosyltransferase
MGKSKIAICMPVFNEGSGIQEFLNEIQTEFCLFDYSLFLVDDFSTDSTESVIFELSQRLPISYIRNEKNLGHGPSTVRALKFALASDCDFILAVDGDGQFHASDMKHLTELCIQNASDIGLGIRLRTNEPKYRKITSWVTRIIVNLKSKSRTVDANTPLRFYTRRALSTLLIDLDNMNPIPNLYISAKILTLNFKIQTLQVEFRERLGDNSESTSWGKSLWSLPNKRFLKFCLKSFKYWIQN